MTSTDDKNETCSEKNKVELNGKNKERKRTKKRIEMEKEKKTKKQRWEANSTRMVDIIIYWQSFAKLSSTGIRSTAHHFSASLSRTTGTTTLDCFDITVCS